MSTPHIKAKKGEIAETILLPGDPLRAKFIAETYLEDVIQFNDIRNMFGYTGTYKGRRISVMGTGMGCPSMGIYSYELIHFYGVKNLIRIGSCGSMQPHLKLYDVIIAMGASTNSNYGEQYELPGIYSATASWELLNKAVKVAEEKKIPVHVGNVLSGDIFYSATENVHERWMKMGVLAAEMEAYALYCNAAYGKAKALVILTVSDDILNATETDPEERERSFTNMMEIALEFAE